MWGSSVVMMGDSSLAVVWGPLLWRAGDLLSFSGWLSDAEVFLNSCGVYVALLHMRNAGSYGAVAEDLCIVAPAGSPQSEFPGAPV